MRAVDIVPYVMQLTEESARETLKPKKEKEDNEKTEGNEKGESKKKRASTAMALAVLRMEHNKRYVATLEAQNKTATVKETTKGALEAIPVASSVPKALIPALRYGLLAFRYINLMLFF